MRILHHPTTRSRSSDDAGVTLLEVIVCLMLLGIIMVPLVMAFTSGLITSRDADERLDKDADMARISEAWTRDVVDVDPTGVYDTGVTGPRSVTTSPCVDPSKPASTPLVSFQSDIAVSAGSVPRQATWSIEGSGVTVNLIRTICLSGTPTTYDVLASNFGTTGASAASLVHGPGGANTAFCTGRSCTIEISGAYSFSLTVGRRVPDLTISSLANSAPPPPRITSLTPQNTALGVSWNPPELVVGQPPVTKYQLEVHANATATSLVKTVSNIDGNAVGVIADSLTNGTQYWVRARAENSVGIGGWSNIYGPGVPRPLPPGGPLVTEIVRGDKELTATWAAVSGATGYRIYARDPSGLELGPVQVGGTTGTIGGLTNGVAYQLLISVTNTDGEGVRGPLSTAARPYGQIPDALTVTARASGSKTITVDFTMPANSADQWINLNGNQAVAMKVALYSVNPTSGSLTGLYGFWTRTAGDAGWSVDATSSPPVYSYTWQAGDGAISDGTSYVFRIKTYGNGEDNKRPSEGSLIDSVPGYNGALTPPGVTPAGTPGKPGAVHQYELPRADQRFDVSFDEPSTSATIDAMLNGGRAFRYSARMDQRAANAASGTAWTTTPIPAPPSGSDCAWCSPAGDTRPVNAYDRVVYDVGPVYGGTEYRLGMRISTKGEWPNAPEVWGDYSTMCNGNTDRQCVVAGVGLTETALAVTLTRPQNAAPQTLSISFKTPNAAVTRYNIVCSGGGAPTKEYPITRSVAANTTVTESLSGLRDGRNYRCTVQLGNASGFGGLTQSANQAMPYGECKLISAVDTYVDDENGSTRGTAANLEVARNGAWYEFGAEANRWALFRWSYTDACSNYSGIAMSSAAYLVDTTLNVFVSDSGTTRTHRVNLITSAWSDSTTWGSRPQQGASPGAWSARNGNSWRSLDVVGQARTQKVGANFGWLIRDDGGDAYNLHATYASRDNGNADIRPHLFMRFYQDGQ